MTIHFMDFGCLYNTFRLIFLDEIRIFTSSIKANPAHDPYGPEGTACVDHNICDQVMAFMIGFKYIWIFSLANTLDLNGGQDGSMCQFVQPRNPKKHYWKLFLDEIWAIT